MSEGLEQLTVWSSDGTKKWNDFQVAMEATGSEFPFAKTEAQEEVDSMTLEAWLYLRAGKEIKERNWR
jgi:hypothetical protein